MQFFVDQQESTNYVGQELHVLYLTSTVHFKKQIVKTHKI